MNTASAPTMLQEQLLLQDDSTGSLDIGKGGEPFFPSRAGAFSFEAAGSCPSQMNFRGGDGRIKSASGKAIKSASFDRAPSSYPAAQQRLISSRPRGGSGDADVVAVVQRVVSPGPDGNQTGSEDDEVDGPPSRGGGVRCTTRRVIQSSSLRSGTQRPSVPLPEFSKLDKLDFQKSRSGEVPGHKSFPEAQEETRTTLDRFYQEQRWMGRELEIKQDVSIARDSHRSTPSSRRSPAGRPRNLDGDLGKNANNSSVLSDRDAFLSTTAPLHSSTRGDAGGQSDDETPGDGRDYYVHQGTESTRIEEMLWGSRGPSRGLVNGYSAPNMMRLLPESCASSYEHILLARGGRQHGGSMVDLAQASFYADTNPAASSREDLHKGLPRTGSSRPALPQRSPPPSSVSVPHLTVTGLDEENYLSPGARGRNASFSGGTGRPVMTVASAPTLVKKSATAMDLQQYRQRGLMHAPAAERSRDPTPASNRAARGGSTSPTLGKTRIDGQNSSQASLIHYMQRFGSNSAASIRTSSPAYDWDAGQQSQPENVEAGSPGFSLQISRMQSEEASRWLSAGGEATVGGGLYSQSNNAMSSRVASQQAALLQQNHGYNFEPADSALAQQMPRADGYAFRDASSPTSPPNSSTAFPQFHMRFAGQDAQGQGSAFAGTTDLGAQLSGAAGMYGLNGYGLDFEPFYHIPVSPGVQMSKETTSNYSNLMGQVGIGTRWEQPGSNESHDLSQLLQMNTSPGVGSNFGGGAAMGEALQYVLGVGGGGDPGAATTFRPAPASSSQQWGQFGQPGMRQSGSGAPVAGARPGDNASIQQLSPSSAARPSPGGAAGFAPPGRPRGASGVNYTLLSGPGLGSPSARNVVGGRARPEGGNTASNLPQPLQLLVESASSVRPGGQGSAKPPETQGSGPSSSGAHTRGPVRAGTVPGSSPYQGAAGPKQGSYGYGAGAPGGGVHGSISKGSSTRGPGGLVLHVPADAQDDGPFRRPPMPKGYNDHNKGGAPDGFAGGKGGKQGSLGGTKGGLAGPSPGLPQGPGRRSQDLPPARAPDQQGGPNGVGKGGKYGNPPPGSQHGAPPAAQGGPNARPPPPVNLMREFKQGKRKSVKLTEICANRQTLSDFVYDQFGSRYVQESLTNVDEATKETFFRQVLPIAHELVYDVFGNYVVQKYFEHGTENQRKALVDALRPEILRLCYQLYGCRVIQTALDCVSAPLKIAITEELRGQIVSLVEDQNGNHVVQKCVEVLPPEKAAWIVAGFAGHVRNLAAHRYGCRVIQRVIEFLPVEICAPLFEEMLQGKNCRALAHHRYGNYVVQYMLERGRDRDVQGVFDLCVAEVREWSCHKFASNIVEKIISLSSDHAERRANLLRAVVACPAESKRTEQDPLSDDERGRSGSSQSPLMLIMKDKFGNYICQRLMKLASSLSDGDALRDQFFQILIDNLPELSKLSYGKHIMFALREKCYMTEEEVSRAIGARGSRALAEADRGSGDRRGSGNGADTDERGKSAPSGSETEKQDGPSES
ncbi:unnamed protein product [Amoebophrya sp. A25]|nr:unnamed protein product [Amoebophrya sp. A25]|eukprot:GSA25T00002085001.1